MAQISELAKLPPEAALVLYWYTIGTFRPVIQQIHYHMQQTITVTEYA